MTHVMVTLTTLTLLGFPRTPPGEAVKLYYCPSSSFFLNWASLTRHPNFQMPPSHFLPETTLPYLKWKRRKKPFIRTQIYCYFRRNDTVFTEEQNPDQCVRLNLELFSGKLNNVEIVNAINTRGIYVLVEYSGYLVLKKWQQNSIL